MGSLTYQRLHSDGFVITTDKAREECLLAGSCTAYSIFPMSFSFAHYYDVCIWGACRRADAPIMAHLWEEAVLVDAVNSG